MQEIKDYSRTKNSTINIVTGTLGQILSILLKFVCRTVFIHTLGTAYLGINGLFSDILSMLSLAELGFDTAISFRLYKPIAERDDRKIREYIIFFRDVYRVIGICIFILGLLLIPFLHYFIADYDTLEGLGINAAFIFVLFLIQNVSTYLFFAYRSITFKVNQKQYMLDIAGYFITIASTVSQIAVLLLFKNFVVFIITTIVFVILQNLIYAILATKRFPLYFKGPKGCLSKDEKRDLFKDCSALFVYKINNVVIKATDNLVLSSFIGLVVVGLYSNYVMIYAGFSGILHVMFRAVKASMGNLFVTDDVKKKYYFFEVMNYVTFLLYGTAAICLAVESNEFIECWIGSKYILPQPVPILIGIELLFTGIKLNLSQIRHVSGVFRQMWYRPILGSLINVTSSIIFVQLWGVSGVIAGTLLAAVFAHFLVDPVVINKYSFKNVFPVSRYYLKNIRFALLLCVIFFIDYYICKSLVVENIVLSLILHLSICAISVISVFLLFFRKSRESIYIVGKVSNIKKNIK